LRILLTGITGLVGASVVTELLRKHPDYEIVGVCRPGRTQTAEERVSSTIRQQCEFDGLPESFDSIIKSIKVVSGDVSCLPFDEIAKYAPYDVMFHCAADVNLGKDPDGKTYATNMNGTKQAVEAVRRFNIPILHYVSTAYVAGKQSGRVMEDELKAKDFVNSYERSKFDAEQYVRASGIPFTIYRPGIVVGRLTDGRLRKPLAFYRILEFIGKLKKNRCVKAGLKPSAEFNLSFRIESETSDKIYFVPIDYVQKAMTTLFELPVENRTYHITGDSPVTTDMICEAVSYVLKARGLVVMSKVEDPTPDEKLLTKGIGDLMPYFTTQIIFDQTNVRKYLGDEALNWVMDLDFLKKMAFAYYKQENPDVID